MNAPFRPETAEERAERAWAHKPSAFAWSVMIYGGLNPRTGFPQPQMEVCFHKRTRPNGYGWSRLSIIRKARDFAEAQKRSHFAVRDTDGAVIFDGPVLAERRRIA